MLSRLGLILGDVSCDIGFSRCIHAIDIEPALRERLWLRDINCYLMRFHTVALLDVSVIYNINLSRRGEGLGKNGFTTVIPFQENPS